MSASRASFGGRGTAVAVATLIAAIGAGVGMIVLAIANRSLGEDGILAPMAVAYASVGAILIARTQNPIGSLSAVIWVRPPRSR